MRKFYSYIVAAILMAGSLNALGQTTATLEITSSVTSTGNLTDNSSNTWAFDTDGALTSNSSYIQAGTNKSEVSYITLETSAYSSKKITRVQVWGTSKANTNVSAKVIIGSTTIGTSDVYTTQNASSGGTEYSVYNTNSVAGNLKLEISRPSSSTGAIYFNKAIVTYLEPHTITFNGNGGTYNAATSYTQTVFDGEATNLTANQFTYADHNFLGWKDANGTDYTNGQSVTLTANLVLTAQWEAIGTDPYITASDVNVAYTATEGSISYTVNNYQSGTMTATKTADWITIGTVTGPHATEHTGTVPFTMNANTGAQRSATVTLSYDFGGSEPATKQVTVTQAVAQYTVTYDKNDNGASGTMSDDDSPYAYGSTVTVLANGFTAPSGEAFDHWSTASDGGTAYDPDDTFNITGDVTLYAQWRTLHTYSLVTSTDQIVPGKHYIIANDTCGNKYAMGGVSSNNNYRERVAVEIYKTNGIIKIAETEGVYEFVISGKDNDDYWTIYDEAQASNHYLAATGNSSNNNMGVVSTAEDRSKWTIEIGADTTATIVAPLITGNDKRSHIRYNTASGQERFSCYKEGSTLPKVYLYVKDNETDGTIYSATTLSKNESYNNLTIVKTVVNNNPVVNGSITVPNAKTLTVTGTLTNQGDAANLIIEDGGKLITKSSGVNATVKKNVAAATNWGTTGDSYTPDGWYFIASPVDDAAFPTGSVNDQDIYQLDWANNNWINLQYSGHSTLLTAGFQRGTGYLYASQAGNTLSVAGEIQPLSNDDNATVTLANNGWNLIGNPLTCAVTVSTAFSELNNESSVTNMDANSVINPFQGIAVNGTAGDVVTFTKAASQNAVGPNNGYGNLQLTLAQNIVTRGTTTTNTIDNAVISFNEGSVLPKFNMLEGNAKLYIPQGTEEYAIVSAEAQGEMPVNFRAAKDGEYTLTVNAENVEMNYLHLIDNLTGADVDLLATPSYTFSARTTDYASRFRLLFGANDENGASTSSATFAYVSNGQVVVNGTGILQVVDMLGRIVASQEVTTANCQLSTANYKTGVYVLRLVNNGDVKTQKMVIE